MANLLGNKPFLQRTGNLIQQHRRSPLQELPSSPSWLQTPGHPSEATSVKQLRAPVNNRKDFTSLPTKGMVGIFRIDQD